MDTTTETLVRGDDNEEFAASLRIDASVLEDLCIRVRNLQNLARVNIYSPELARPYSFPLFMAR